MGATSPAEGDGERDDTRPAEGEGGKDCVNAAAAVATAAAAAVVVVVVGDSECVNMAAAVVGSGFSIKLWLLRLPGRTLPLLLLSLLLLLLLRVMECSALWSGTDKNRDVSTGPPARPFARSLTSLTPSLVGK